MPEQGPGRVVVVGSIGLDRTVRCRELPGPGETVLASELLLSVGGKGSNQAVGASSMGAETVMVAKVGDDADGAGALADLRAAGVGTAEMLTDPSAPTGQAFVWVSDDGENSIVVVSGANAALTHAEVAAALARLCLVPGDVVLTCAEIPVAALEAVPAQLGDGIAWVHNAAPAGALPRWGGHPPVLVVNEIEAEQLTGLADVERAAQQLAGSVAAVVVTVGGDGALVAVGGRLDRIAAPVVTVVDTTGAGDAFCGALAAGLAAGRPLAEAVVLATGAGAVAVTGLGARGALARPDAVRRLLEG